MTTSEYRLHAAEAATGQIESEEARVTVTVEPDVADTFESNPQYAELIDDVVEADRMAGVKGTLVS